MINIINYIMVAGKTIVFLMTILIALERHVTSIPKDAEPDIDVFVYAFAFTRYFLT